MFRKLEMMFLTAALASAALFVIGGCKSETVLMETSIRTPCNQATDVVFKDSQLMRLTVSGSDLPDSIFSSFPYSDGRGTLSSVPFTKNFKMNIESFNSEEPSTGGLVSSGQTMPFDLSASSGSNVKINVLMSAVEKFGKTTDYTTADTTCTTMPSLLQGSASLLLPGGKVLITGGYTVKSSSKLYSDKLILFDPGTGLFNVITDSNGDAVTMFDPRALHTATLINVGTKDAPSWKILIAGGLTFLGDNEQTLARAELFDANSMQREQIIEMKQGRANHTATDLSGGVVVLIGGMKQEYNSQTKKTDQFYLNDAEYYDPGTGSMTAVPSLMRAQRAEHTAAHIVSKVDGDGIVTEQIFLFGGRNQNGLTPIVEYYDHGKQKFAVINDSVKLAVSRYGHGASTILISQSEPSDSGEVLFKYRVVVAGGYQCVESCSASSGPNCCGADGGFKTLDQSITARIEVFDPSETLNFMETDKTLNMTVSRAKFTMSNIADRRALAAGGRTLSDYNPSTSTETKKPPLQEAEIISFNDKGAYLDSKATDKMADKRTMQSAVTLSSGMVVIMGGNNDTASLGSAEIYNPRVEIVPNPE